MNFIEWCNNNQGFISATLTIFTILLSILAIAISIRTAKLPYLKKVKLYSKSNFGVYDTLQGAAFKGLSCTVGIVNIGNRAIYIDYLGLGFYLNGRIQKFTPLNRKLECKKRIEPTETCEVEFLLQELKVAQQRIDRDEVIYAILIDTEGKIHKKRIGTLSMIIKSLEDF